jgi:hypothetical protein
MACASKTACDPSLPKDEHIFKKVVARFEIEFR